jgi:hypothetical protein
VCVVSRIYASKGPDAGITYVCTGAGPRPIAVEMPVAPGIHLTIDSPKFSEPVQRKSLVLVKNPDKDRHYLFQNNGRLFLLASLITTHHVRLCLFRVNPSPVLRSPVYASP